MALEVKKRGSAEARLVESDERFDFVFSEISDMVLVWDDNHAYIYANQSALDHVNLSKEEVYGKKIKDILPEGRVFADLWQRRLERTFSDGKRRRHEDNINQKPHPYVRAPKLSWFVVTP